MKKKKTNKQIAIQVRQDGGQSGTFLHIYMYFGAFRRPILNDF